MQKRLTKATVDDTATMAFWEGGFRSGGTRGQKNQIRASSCIFAVSLMVACSVEGARIPLLRHGDDMPADVVAAFALGSADNVTQAFTEEECTAEGRSASLQTPPLLRRVDDMPPDFTAAFAFGSPGDVAQPIAARSGYMVENGGVASDNEELHEGRTPPKMRRLNAGPAVGSEGGPVLSTPCSDSNDVPLEHVCDGRTPPKMRRLAAEESHAAEARAEEPVLTAFEILSSEVSAFWDRWSWASKGELAQGGEGAAKVMETGVVKEGSPSPSVDAAAKVAVVEDGEGTTPAEVETNERAQAKTDGCSASGSDDGHETIRTSSSAATVPSAGQSDTDNGGRAAGQPLGGRCSSSLFAFFSALEDLHQPADEGPERTPAAAYAHGLAGIRLRDKLVEPLSASGSQEVHGADGREVDQHRLLEQVLGHAVLTQGRMACLRAEGQKLQQSFKSQRRGSVKPTTAMIQALETRAKHATGLHSQATASQARVLAQGRVLSTSPAEKRSHQGERKLAYGLDATLHFEASIEVFKAQGTTTYYLLLTTYHLLLTTYYLPGVQGTRHH